MEGGKAVSVTKRTGDRGEAEVAKYLRKKGYTLLASQWRCRFGELDLVAKSKRGVICFVAVSMTLLSDPLLKKICLEGLVDTIEEVIGVLL